MQGQDRLSVRQTAGLWVRPAGLVPRQGVGASLSSRCRRGGVPPVKYRHAQAPPVLRERLFFKFGIKIQRFDAGQRRVQRNGFGQVADLAAKPHPRFATGTFAQKHHFAFGRGNQPEYQLHNGGLARAVVSGKPDAFSCLQNQIDLVDGFLRPKPFGYLPQFDMMCGHGCSFCVFRRHLDPDAV